MDPADSACDTLPDSGDFRASGGEAEGEAARAPEAILEQNSGDFRMLEVIEQDFMSVKTVNKPVFVEICHEIAGG